MKRLAVLVMALCLTLFSPVSGSNLKGISDLRNSKVSDWINFISFVKTAPVKLTPQQSEGFNQILKNRGRSHKCDGWYVLTLNGGAYDLKQTVMLMHPVNYDKWVKHWKSKNTTPVGNMIRLKAQFLGSLGDGNSYLMYYGNILTADDLKPKPKPEIVLKKDVKEWFEINEKNLIKNQKGWYGFSLLSKRYYYEKDHKTGVKERKVSYRKAYQSFGGASVKRVVDSGDIKGSILNKHLDKRIIKFYYKDSQGNIKTVNVLIHKMYYATFFNAEDYAKLQQDEKKFPDRIIEAPLKSVEEQLQDLLDNSMYREGIHFEVVEATSEQINYSGEVQHFIVIDNINKLKVK